MMFLRGFLISLQFLTAIPIKRSFPMDQRHIEKSVQTYPLLGLAQGIIYSVVLYIFIEWTPFSILAIAALLCLLTFVITGGLHLDGWMDMSDAYFSYQDHERKLEIMADSRTGAFGVIALIVLLSSRLLFIYEILSMADEIIYLLIIFIPFLSKTVLGFVLIFTPAAKESGMAFFMKQACNKKTFRIFPFYIVLLLGMISLWKPSTFFPVLTMIVVSSCLALFIQRKAVTWFGGVTGDVFGATVEGTENILWMTLWIFFYFVTV